MDLRIYFKDKRQFKEKKIIFFKYFYANVFYFDICYIINRYFYLKKIRQNFYNHFYYQQYIKNDFKIKYIDKKILIINQI